MAIQMYLPKYSSNRIPVMFKNIQWFSIAFQIKDQHHILAFKANHSTALSLHPTFSPDKMKKRQFLNFKLSYFNNFTSLP